MVQAAAATNLRWFAVHTLPKKEGIAVSHLHQQGFQTFFPRMLTTRRHARKTEILAAAFFPRYVFVRLDLDWHRWRSVNGTVGVHALVMNGERPLPVPEGIMEGLTLRADANGIISPDDDSSEVDDLKPGDAVRLTGGPLGGELGTLMRLDRRGRVEMLIGLMNGMVRVRVARALLEAAA